MMRGPPRAASAQMQMLGCPAARIVLSCMPSQGFTEHVESPSGLACTDSQIMPHPFIHTAPHSHLYPRFSGKQHGLHILHA